MPPTAGDPISRRVQVRDIAMPGVIDRAAGERTAHRLSRFGVGDSRLAERVRGRWIMAKELGVQAEDLPFVRGKFVTDLPESGSLEPSPEKSPEKSPVKAPARQPLQVVAGRRVSGQSLASRSVVGQGMQDRGSNAPGTASASVMRSDIASPSVVDTGSSSAREITAQAGTEAVSPPGEHRAATETPVENSSQPGGPTAHAAVQAGSAGQPDTPADVVQRASADHPLSGDLAHPAPVTLPLAHQTPDAGSSGQPDAPANALQTVSAEQPLPGDPGEPVATRWPLVRQAPDAGSAGQPDVQPDVLPDVLPDVPSEAPSDALQRGSAGHPAAHPGDPASTRLQFVRAAPGAAEPDMPGAPADLPQGAAAAVPAAYAGSASTTAAAANPGSGSGSPPGGSMHSLPVVRAQRRSEGAVGQVTSPGTAQGDTLAAPASRASVQRAAEPGGANEEFQGTTQPALRPASGQTGGLATKNLGSRIEPRAPLQQVSQQASVASAEKIASRAVRWGAPIVQRRSSAQGESFAAGIESAQSLHPPVQPSIQPSILPPTEPTTASRQGAESVRFSPAAAIPAAEIGRSTGPAQDQPSSPIVHAAARPSVAAGAASEAANSESTASDMPYAPGTPQANSATMGSEESQGLELPAPLMQRVMSAPPEHGEQAVAASLPLVTPTKATPAPHPAAEPVRTGSTAIAAAMSGSIQASSLEGAGHIQTRTEGQTGAAHQHLGVQGAESTTARPYAARNDTGIPQPARLSTAPGGGQVVVARAAVAGAPRRSSGTAIAPAASAGEFSAPRREGTVSHIRRAPAAVSDTASGAALYAQRYGAVPSSGLPASAAVQPEGTGAGSAGSENSPYRTSALLQAQPEPPVHGGLSPAGATIAASRDTPLPLRRETFAGKALGFEGLEGPAGAYGGAGGALRPPVMPVAAAAGGHTGMDGITRVQRQSSASASASSASSASSAGAAGAASATAPPPSGAAQGAQGTALDGLELERVATAVYGIIRDRLIVERESRGL